MPSALEFSIQKVLPNYDDLSALHLLMMMHGMEMAEAPVSGVKVMQKIADAARTPSTGMFLARFDGKPVGYLCIERAEYWYADAHFMTDFGFYVHPDFRRLGIARQLKARAEAFAAERGLKLKLYKPARELRASR